MRPTLSLPGLPCDVGGPAGVLCPSTRQGNLTEQQHPAKIVTVAVSKPTVLKVTMHPPKWKYFILPPAQCPAPCRTASLRALLLVCAEKGYAPFVHTTGTSVCSHWGPPLLNCPHQVTHGNNALCDLLQNMATPPQATRRHVIPQCAAFLFEDFLQYKKNTLVKRRQNTIHTTAHCMLH